MKTKWSKKSLYRDDMPVVTVGQLIEKLEKLPQDQEIVLYPKYDVVDGYRKHRFLIENVQEQNGNVYGDMNEGIIGQYDYCAIIF